MLSKKNIRQKASTYVGPDQALPPINIWQTILDQGIQIEHLPIKEQKEGIKYAGKLYYDSQEDMWSIYYADTLSWESQRYIVAHMFGHYVLHGEPNREAVNVIGRKVQVGAKDLEADVFAREILMPKHLVLSEGEEAAQETDDEFQFLEEMAERFCVKSHVMKAHLDTFGVTRNKLEDQKTNSTPRF